jgi:aspartyl-tRNA synthetase
MQQATVPGGGFGRSSPSDDLGCLERYHRVREDFSRGYPVLNGIAVGYDRLVLSLVTAQND